MYRKKITTVNTQTIIVVADLQIGIVGVTVVVIIRVLIVKVKERATRMRLLSGIEWEVVTHTAEKLTPDGVRQMIIIPKRNWAGLML
jgi:hypothetical protein